jgi:hypothetical protein
MRSAVLIIVWAFLLAGTFGIFAIAKDPALAADVRYFLRHGHRRAARRLPVYTITVGSDGRER